MRTTTNQPPARATCLTCSWLYAGTDTTKIAERHAAEEGHRVALPDGTHLVPWEASRG